MPAVTPALVPTLPSLTKIRTASGRPRGNSRTNFSRRPGLGATRDTPPETEQRPVRERGIDARATGHEQRIDVACPRQAFRDPGDARGAAHMASDTGDQSQGIALRHLECGDGPSRIEQLEPWKDEHGDSVRHGRKGGQRDIAATTIGGHTGVVNLLVRRSTSVSYPMNIGEAAQAAGLTPKMIRDYEALGLIPQASRTESGYRQYTKRDVDMLRFIRQARSMSFSIKQVEQLLSLWSDT